MEVQKVKFWFYVGNFSQVAFSVNFPEDWFIILMIVIICGIIKATKLKSIFLQ